MAGKIVLFVDVDEEKVSSVKFREQSGALQITDPTGAELSNAKYMTAVGSMYIQKAALGSAFGDQPVRRLKITIEQNVS